MTDHYDLPSPSQEDAYRSQALTAFIKQKIASIGHITFADFMESALYHPEYGYYTSPRFALGKEGDFTTAPEISPVFAQCFAHQCQPIILELGDADILELGAGSGKLAADLLKELHALNCLPQHYYIFEISETLRNKQKAYLQQTCPDFFARITWLETLPEKLTGIIIANEVLDALPFNCIRFEKDEIKERVVCWENEQFAWKIKPASPELQSIAAEIDMQCGLAGNYESEVNLQLSAFVRDVANTLERGVILFSDYGYGQHEYYHPQRNQGTLTCFYQHRKHDNPFLWPGLQDITAHVDFTRVIEIAFENGCTLGGFTTQTGFLLACGLTTIADELKKTLNPVDEFKLNQAIKILTLPSEMGETIKVMGLIKNLEITLLGFNLYDRSRDL